MWCTTFAANRKTQTRNLKWGMGTCIDFLKAPAARLAGYLLRNTAVPAAGRRHRTRRSWKGGGRSTQSCSTLDVQSLGHLAGQRPDAKVPLLVGVPRGSGGADQLDPGHFLTPVPPSRHRPHNCLKNGFRCGTTARHRSKIHNPLPPPALVKAPETMGKHWGGGVRQSGEKLQKKNPVLCAKKGKVPLF